MTKNLISWKIDAYMIEVIMSYWQNMVIIAIYNIQMFYVKNNTYSKKGQHY